MNPTTKPLTILVAEDDNLDRAFIRKAWEASRVVNDLRFVEDGEELTQYLNHTGKYSDPASSPRPAVILLDLNMPKKDGREALREIKADPKLRQIPVIVLTTSQAEEDICRSYDLGANSYIAKPATFEALVDALQVLGKYWVEIVDFNPDRGPESDEDGLAAQSITGTGPNSSVTIPTKPTKGGIANTMSTRRASLTVLVADDDDDDRGYIKKAWEKNRVSNELIFVDDGEELTEYLNHSGRYSEPGSSPRPAVILLDLNMPKKDGRESLREIKANPKLRQIPTIVFTTSQAEEDILGSYDLGANSYITKPVTFGALVDVLRVLGKYWIEIVELPPENIAT